MVVSQKGLQNHPVFLGLFVNQWLKMGRPVCELKNMKCMNQQELGPLVSRARFVAYFDPSSALRPKVSSLTHLAEVG